MSGDARSQKKKDKRKRKEDEIDLLESNEKSGSGLCVKLVFLLLIGSVGLAIGVVFLEIDASRDISSLVATSTAKVSAVLEETSASVSSLWEEHGSSVSSLFESVKQSIGMEGEAPLENLADKKDVESPVSEPVEKLEEFFDEGEEIVDYPIEADYYSAPIEKADGDVAPEPVQPADSYEEPESKEVPTETLPEEVSEEPIVQKKVSYELEQPVLAEAEELDQEAESSEDQVDSTEQLTESVEDQIIPDEAQATLTQEVPEPTSAVQLDDEPVVADSAEADQEEDALSIEEETENVSVEQDQVAEPEVVITRDHVIQEEAVPADQEAEASQEEADSVEQAEPEIVVTQDGVAQEEADSVEQEAEPEIVVTRDEVVLEEAVPADQEAEASQEGADSVEQVAEPEVVVSRDEAVQEEAVPFDQESEPSLSQEVGSEETEDFIPDTPLDEGSEELEPAVEQVEAESDQATVLEMVDVVDMEDLPVVPVEASEEADETVSEVHEEQEDAAKRDAEEVTTEHQDIASETVESKSTVLPSEPTLQLDEKFDSVVEPEYEASDSVIAEETTVPETEEVLPGDAPEVIPPADVVHVDSNDNISPVEEVAEQKPELLEEAEKEVRENADEIPAEKLETSEEVVETAGATHLDSSDAILLTEEKIEQVQEPEDVILGSADEVSTKKSDTTEKIQTADTMPDDMPQVDLQPDTAHVDSSDSPSPVVEVTEQETEQFEKNTVVVVSADEIPSQELKAAEQIVDAVYALLDDAPEVVLPVEEVIIPEAEKLQEPEQAAVIVESEDGIANEKSEIVAQEVDALAEALPEVGLQEGVDDADSTGSISPVEEVAELVKQLEDPEQVAVVVESIEEIQEGESQSVSDGGLIHSLEEVPEAAEPDVVSSTVYESEQLEDLGNEVEDKPVEVVELGLEETTLQDADPRKVDLVETVVVENEVQDAVSTNEASLIPNSIAKPAEDLVDVGSEAGELSGVREKSIEEDVVETQTFDEEVPEIVEAVPQIVVSSPASSPEEVPVVAIVNDAENEIFQSEEVEEDSQEALKVESVPKSDVIVEEPISVKEEQAEQRFAGSYGAPPTPEVPVVAVVNDAENEIFQSEEVEEDSQESLKAAYSKIDITNDDDWEIREELDDAESAISKSGLEALAMFEDILRDHPDSPRALYGRALALHKLSEKERSNSRLEQAIFAYRNVIDLERAVPDALYRLAGNHCVERMKFRGFQGKAIRTQQRLILRFPNDLSLQNELVVIYLTVGQNDAAKELLLEILKTWPDSGFAKVHYGFILKNVDNNMEEGAKYMKEGIDSGEAGTSDGRFFYHLGDALERLGRREDAKKVYEDGAKRGLFRSKDQRSLYNVDRLQSKPFWTQEETTYQDFFRKLESNWEVIRDEGVSLMNLTPPEGFKNEAESLRDTGDWKQFELFARGRKLPGCAKAPKTCALLETFSPASTCKRGQAKFSVMHPGTHVWPHTGPTNCRLRSHLGLKVPDNVFLRVADETKKWEEGKLFIFDDSFDHEVWHNGTSFRLVLIVDVWHPDLTENERQTLTAI